MNNKNILAIGIIILIITGISAYLLNKKKVNPIPSVSPVVSDSPSASLAPTLPPEVWETYTNSELGFSINYPRMVYGLYRCSPYKNIYVPVKVFEDNKNGIAYITHEYYYEAPYGEELKDYTEPCEKINYSLETLKQKRDVVIKINNNVSVNTNPILTWVVATRNVNNKAELIKFIRDGRGYGCNIEKETLWKQQNGVYEIEVRGGNWEENMHTETTTCLQSSKYKILYAPEKNKAMMVNLGQECNFVINPGTESFKCYDDEMIDSFKFE